MSFRCADCKVKVAPKVKPVKIVTGTREKDYTNFKFDEEARSEVVVASHGHEIVGEKLICPKCALLAGLINQAQLEGAFPKPPPTFKDFKTSATAMCKHITGYRTKAGKQVKPCRKDRGECKTCTFIEAEFAKMPLPALSAVLQDSKAIEVGVTLGSLVLSSAMDRTMHESKRAVHESNAALSLLKHYEREGGRI